MNKLRKLTLPLVVICLLTARAIAGETSSPPCPDLGETSSPPCSVTQFVGDDSATQNQAASLASGTTSDYSINDATVDVLLAALSLF